MTRRLRVLLLALGVVLVGSVPQASAAQPGTWNFSQAGVPGAQGPGGNGAGVLVAVIDTYIDAGHPDFGGRVLAGGRCTAGRCSSGQVADSCTHGTHVAGTVASSTFGVAPGARVLPVQVLLDDGSGECGGTTADVAAGIDFAVANGATVLNLSLGSLVPGISSSSAIAGAVRRAFDRGVVVVFAAGNSTLPLADSYGASALIVAATGPGGGIAAYSQRGSGVTLAAPGGDSNRIRCTAENCVKSLFPGNRVALLEGTSMAAPHVAGVAALLQAQQRRSPSQVRDRLTSTARPLIGAGAGVLDATAALRTAAAAAPVQAQPAPQPAPPPAQAAPPAGRPGGGAAPAPGSPSPAAPGPGAAGPAAPTGSVAAPGGGGVVGAPAPVPGAEAAPATVVGDAPAGGTAAPDQATSGLEVVPVGPADPLTDAAPASTDLAGEPATAVALLLLVGVGSGAFRALRRADRP